MSEYSVWKSTQNQFYDRLKSGKIKEVYAVIYPLFEDDEDKPVYKHPKIKFEHCGYIYFIFEDSVTYKLYSHIANNICVSEEIFDPSKYNEIELVDITSAFKRDLLNIEFSTKKAQVDILGSKHEGDVITSLKLKYANDSMIMTSADFQSSDEGYEIYLHDDESILLWYSQDDYDQTFFIDDVQYADL